jgi:predicted phosphodiesterase
MKSDKIVGRPIRLNLCKLIPKQNSYAEVMFIGDLHWGSPQCDINRFLGNLNYCLANNVYVYLMGDLTETATRHSVGAGIYEQECIADKQHEDLIGWLQPLADKKLILGTHAGNHGDRVFKETGFNMEKALARELKVPYLGDACWSRFKVGKEAYTLYTLHGRTGSRFDGTALLALERISASFFADAIVMGHTHKCINSIVLMQRIVDRRVVEHKKHLIIAGHYVSYDRGYGQALGLPLSKLGSPKVKFFTNKHDILVSW